MRFMKLLAHEPATVEDVRSAHVEQVERAHAHLNGRPVLPPTPARPAIVLKKLSNRHKQAISLILQGVSREEAAEATGFVPQYMTFLLQQPIAKDFIAHVNRAVATQLEALYGKSVAAISDGLNHRDPEVALKAAKLQLQTTGRLEPDEEGKKTAEDVVQAILLGVNINVNTK